ncbi:uncharacterized protein LOC127242256 [Andrographis paniculata]|uniref:uncharacterized protein LOC127242256 n=1 Tax=Andrographis paniculata TaxID=175694 RepID=UPI0021E7A76D|nr:uncharacterized protein LOC127242256 [Andrographis paniculata]
METSLRINSPPPFPTSRSFGRVAVEISNCSEVGAAAIETPPDSCKDEDTVEALLLKDKDDISRLMKMERRSESSDEFKHGDKRKRWFPYLDRYRVGDTSLSSGEVVEAMDPYIMEARKERFRNVINSRSYSVCLVVEGLSDFGNVSAAFRSADALGVQSVHVVSCDASRSIELANIEEFGIYMSCSLKISDESNLTPFLPV